LQFRGCQAFSKYSLLASRLILYHVPQEAARHRSIVVNIL
jgi:hypothetical protein